jgi:hypothetical protein
MKQRVKHRSAILSTLVLGITIALPAASQTTGYYYEAITRAEEEQSRNALTTTVRGWIDGSQAKIEYQDRDQSGMFEAGSYLLTTDGGATLYLVNPSARSYTEMDLDAMFGMVGNVMGAVGGVVNMEFSDFVNERVAERADEPILGYPTRFYQYNTGYTMSMRVLGMRRESRTETEQQVWCASGIEADGFGVWLRPDRFRTGNEELDRMIAQEYGAIDCLPLRSRTTTTVSGTGSRSTTSTSSMEVTVLREEAVPANTFVLPADYEQVPLLGGMPEDLRELLEQSRQAEPDSGATDDGGGRRPRLRDLLNR